VAELTQRFPWVRFIDARDRVDAARFGAGSREHHDILRAIGLHQAQGRLVALLEDHGTPSEGWCAAVFRAHDEPGVAAVGGAVENGVDRLLNWAVYFCDFGRYQNPVPEGPSEFLSDANVSYKRDALFGVQDLWREAFHETSVHWELRGQGHQLVLDRRMAVYQTRDTLRLGAALRERFVWARSFAGTRARESTVAQRAVRAATAWLLPLVLTQRIVRTTWSRGSHIPKLLSALPLIFLLECVWACGELVGYVTGRTEARPAAAASLQQTRGLEHS
jgi:hypothetical protein